MRRIEEMKMHALRRWSALAAPCAVAVLAGACAGQAGTQHARDVDTRLSMIRHVVVIYGENRRFDNLYGTFPGASGIADAGPVALAQLDLDGTPLTRLPPVWKGSGEDPAFGHD